MGTVNKESEVYSYTLYGILRTRLSQCEKIVRMKGQFIQQNISSRLIK